MRKKKYKYITYSIEFKYDGAKISESTLHFMGKHMGWHGRPYRRGKNRCSYCGSPIDAPNDRRWLAKKRDRLMAECLNDGFSTVRKDPIGDIF